MTIEPKHIVSVNTFGQYEVLVSKDKQDPTPITYWDGGEDSLIAFYLLERGQSSLRTFQEDLLFDTTLLMPSEVRNLFNLAKRRIQERFSAAGLVTDEDQPLSLLSLVGDDYVVNTNHPRAVKVRPILYDLNLDLLRLEGAQSLLQVLSYWQMSDLVDEFVGDFMPGFSGPWIEGRRLVYNSMVANLHIAASKENLNEFRMAHHLKNALRRGAAQTVVKDAMEVAVSEGQSELARGVYSRIFSEKEFTPSPELQSYFDNL